MADFEIRGAIWLNDDHTAANCEIFTDTLGAWVPYSVSSAHLDDGLARAVWETLKTIVVQEPAPEPESLKVARARLVRDKYLEDTDVFMLIDYPVTEERRAVITAYRQYLRDLPSSEPEWYLKHIKTLTEWEAEHGN